LKLIKAILLMGAGLLFMPVICVGVYFIEEVG